MPNDFENDSDDDVEVGIKKHDPLLEGDSAGGNPSSNSFSGSAHSSGVTTSSVGGESTKQFFLAPLKDSLSDQSNTAPKVLPIPLDGSPFVAGRNPQTGVVDNGLSRELCSFWSPPSSASEPTLHAKAMRQPNKIMVNGLMCLGASDPDSRQLQIGDVISLLEMKYRYTVSFGILPDGFAETTAVVANTTQQAAFQQPASAPSRKKSQVSPSGGSASLSPKQSSQAVSSERRESRKSVSGGSSDVGGGDRATRRASSKSGKELQEEIKRRGLKRPNFCVACLTTFNDWRIEAGATNSRLGYLVFALAFIALVAVLATLMPGILAKTSKRG